MRQSEVTAINTVLCVTPKASYVNQLALGVVFALSCLIDVHRCSDGQAAHDSKDNTEENSRPGREGAFGHLQE